MAPTAQHSAGQWQSQLSQPTALPELLHLAGRANANASPTLTHFTLQQQRIQICLAMISASISIVSAFIFLYWFIKMRRNFRHHLIIILIVSDIFKSVWYLIFPAVVVTQGVVRDSSAFCQASGFFVAMGVEASDFATLVIAVHTALYIFKTGNAVSGAGLYRYRYVVYSCWATFSLIMASVVFVNHTNPYVSQGTFCYLPVRPIWFRLALAWVPRYVIFGTIVGIYVAIYIYVKYKFKGVPVKVCDSDLAPQTSRVSTDDEQSPGTNSLLGKQVIPSTPVLATHGLTDSTEELDITNNRQSADPPNSFTPSTTQGNSASGNAASTAAPVWENYTFGARAILAPPPRGGTPLIERPRLQADGESSEASNSPQSMERRIGLVQILQESRRPSSFDPLTDGSAPGSRRPTLFSKGGRPIDLLDSNGSNVATRSLRRRQIAIHRQLRYMFTYPTVYILMWFLPFVGHCLNYSDHYSRYPMYGINCCIVVIIPLQCAVDCWLFAYREKPWQYIPGSRGTFWNSFAFWTHDRQGGAGAMPPALGVGNEGPWRSQREMSADSILAYQRREEELGRLTASRVSRDEESRSKKSSSARSGRGGDLNWWEEEGRLRQDSVWMGTEGSTKPGRSERNPAIEEEDENSEGYTSDDEEQARTAAV